MIPNHIGSALGIYYVHHNTKIFIMPGVPNEMQNMMKNYIIPKFMKQKPQNNFITIKTAGIMESSLAELINPLIKKYSTICKFAFLPDYSGVSFRINLKNQNIPLEKIKIDFFKKMQPFAYGFNNDSLTSVVTNIMINKNLTLSLAESCTGGLIGKLLTDNKGSSKFFKGGITAYSNDLKLKLLGVKKITLKKYGAVSKETALEMAQGIKHHTKSDIAISTTGISGPNGGTQSKPIGIVYIGIIAPNYKNVKKYIFNVNRNIHRKIVAYTAINLARLSIE